MHITASVFINDNESGLHQDFDAWLEKLAPEKPHSQEPLSKVPIKVAPFLECGNSFAAFLISALFQDREPPVLGRTSMASHQFRPFYGATVRQTNYARLRR